MSKVCALTGHRKLNDTNFDAALMDRVLLNLVINGVDTFLCGMALGFDIEAAHSVLQLKEKYDIKLVACVPCADQSAHYSARNKEVYDGILSRCDEVITMNCEYKNGCMHERDRYMVDNSEVVVCFLRKKSGGTYYTVNYAKKCGKKIIEL